MIGWTPQAAAIKSLFGRLAIDPALVVEPEDGEGGTRSFSAEWKEGKGPSAIHEKQRFALQLKVTNVTPIGEDEVRRVLSNGTVSSVTQTGPGNGGLVAATGPISETASGLLTVTGSGTVGVATCSWTFGESSGSGSITNGMALGDTGLIFSVVVPPAPPSFTALTTYAWTATAGGLAETVCGHRKVTLQVQAHVPERTDELWGIGVLERLRARLSRPSSHVTLHAAGLSLIEARPTVKATYRDAGRMINAASMDVMLGAVFNDLDPTLAGWIETIDLTSHVMVGESEISQQMVAEVIPEA